MIPETKLAWDAFSGAGFLATNYDFEDSGVQLPEVMLRNSMTYFSAANLATTAYPFLTIVAANLINTFGSIEQKNTFLPPMLTGQYSGTMALTESGQGSALADIKTSAVLAEVGSYRLFGRKMFISGSDHNITDIIVHMVLANIVGAPALTKGISLFICPKCLINDDGALGQRNDVVLAILLHKRCYRRTTSTVLHFGENKGAVGYLVGEPHKGIYFMFQMINKARIGVALGASVLGYQGFNCSLIFARDHPQRRLPSSKKSTYKQFKIIEHSDIRRMLLVQKAYSECALAMCLYASSLFEDSHTEQERQKALLLLDLITPMVKYWPSKYCLKANELAIQILVGSGYIREYPLEQYYRDNRLNSIHEGTEAIHGIDILGRKVLLNKDAGFKLFTETVLTTIELAQNIKQLESLTAPLGKALTELNEVNKILTNELIPTPDLAIANASIYLDLFGRIIASWIWLKQALKAAEGLKKVTK
jgi:alkylation response protein AidB-like acyl-CoA dehydrogenase